MRLRVRPTRRQCYTGVQILPWMLITTGCLKYAKVKNPDPVRDLKANVSVVRVSRVFKGSNAEERIAIDLRVLAPRDSFIELGREPVLLLPRPGSWGTPLTGRLDTVSPEAARQAPGAVVEPGRSALVRVGVQVPEERIEPGREHRLLIAWCMRAARDGPCRRSDSRIYELRIVKVNYAAVAGLGLVLAGTLFALGGT